MPCYAIDGLVPVVDPTAFVHPDAVLIGDVHVGPSCYIGPCASLRGDFGRIVIGEGANVQDGCVLHSFPDREVVVEANGHIGHGAVLHGCVVRHDAMIGIGAVVMDNAEVGPQAIVGACAFVAAGTRLPARSLALGVPAKVVRELGGADLARKLHGTHAYQELARLSLVTLEAVAPLERAEPGRRRLGWPAIEQRTDQ